MIIKPVIPPDDAALEVLKSAGVIAPPAETGSEKGNRLAKILAAKGLGVDSLVEQLANLTYSQDESIRFRAIEKGLALNGVGKEETQSPEIIIKIVPRNRTEAEEIPSILLPRTIEASFESRDLEETEESEIEEENVNV